jgi:hypothetical protein
MRLHHGYQVNRMATLVALGPPREPSESGS